MSIAVLFRLWPDADDAMANHLKMAELQTILAPARGGWSDRHNARELRVYRETVGQHLRPADSVNLTHDAVSRTASEGGDRNSIPPRQANSRPETMCYLLLQNDRKVGLPGFFMAGPDRGRR